MDNGRQTTDVERFRSIRVKHDFETTRHIFGFMRSVFYRHRLGHHRRGPERFRHRRQKSIVVGYCIGSFCRVYHLFDIRVPKGEKITIRNLTFAARQLLAAGFLLLSVFISLKSRAYK
jgi:hypothetical protein